MRSQICASRRCAIRFTFGACMLAAALLLAPTVVMAETRSPEATSSIVVEGNRRVEADTVRSYFRVGPGERLDPLKADEGVKALFATGLFADVRYRWEGGRLVVTVVENQVISRIQFEGNGYLTKDFPRMDFVKKATIER